MNAETILQVEKINCLIRVQSYLVNESVHYKENHD